MPDNHTVALADSAQYIRTLGDQSVDLIFTDPPYNLNKYMDRSEIDLPGRKNLNRNFGNWDDPHFEPADWLDEFKRILAPGGNIFVFTSYHMIGKWHEAFDPVFDTFQFMVWHKTNPAPNVRRAGFLNSCELIACMWNKSHTWNFSKQNEMHNFIETSICMGNERLKDPHHPTQKPLKVLEPIVAIASDPGGLVFDPFMGVGSTGEAALKLGRRFLGVEKEEYYFKAARKRLAPYAGE